jgi:hypothetical protein
MWRQYCGIILPGAGAALFFVADEDKTQGVPLTSAEAKTRLYELALENGCSASPCGANSAP